MEDPKLIACLFAVDQNSITPEAIFMNKDTSLYIQPQKRAKSGRRSRESTVSVGGDEDPTSYPGLQLTFKPAPRDGQGYILGTEKKLCNIVLPDLKKISRRHCSLTFDENRRLVLRDFSRTGTTVTYGGKGKEKRDHFTWILSGDEGIQNAEIVIQIDQISFRIVVAKHDIDSRSYVDNVDQFLRETNAWNETSFGALGIHSAKSSALQSGTHTPQASICIVQEKLGEGGFSIVNRVWDVSTGFVYASKQFKKIEGFNWEKEVYIMRKISLLSHEHIVRFIDSKEIPYPQMILEFLPLGSLKAESKRQKITDREILTVLCQSLDALRTIHEQGLTHRDIKPENILVQSRDPLHIKLADFGLAKATYDLWTICGTRHYAAPEIFRGTAYANAVDIWSLGVVILRYVHGLPKFDGQGGKRWCRRLVKRLHDCESDILLDFISTTMLIMDPKSRLSAKNCWKQALQLVLPESRSSTPTQSHGGGQQGEEEDIGTTQESLNHYLTEHNTDNEDSEDHSSTEVPPKASKNKRKKGARPASTTKRLKQAQAEDSISESDSTSDDSGSPQPTVTLFGQKWLQDPNCVGSSAAALGGNTEERSGFSSGTSSGSKSKGQASASGVINEQDSDHDPWAMTQETASSSGIGDEEDSDHDS
ncbi:hypothetical protein MMC30_003868 [Trapelia coarctata]|nr:hypothetical protein [Trapelia coarctata]